MQPIFLLTVAVAVSMLVIPMALRLAPRIGMVDVPDPRKVHAIPIPRVGGWGIVAGSLLPPLLLLQLDPLLQSYVSGSLILLLFGAWDDARQISHWPKFVGQLAAVALVVFYGDLYVTRLPFLEGDVLAGLPGQVFTLVAMTGVINALNHSDGLDGLAGGEAILSLIGIAFLGYLVDSQFVLYLSLSTIGGIFGFLRFNTHPARVFMGDAGSQFLGFTLALLVVYLAQVANPAASAAMPVLVLGLPVADILVVLYLRASQGMHWLKATRNHVHHRLLDLGFSHFEVVVLNYALHTVLVLAAVVWRYAPDIWVVGVYFAVLVSFFVALAVARAREWRWRASQQEPALARVPQPVLAALNGLRWPVMACVCVEVPLFLLAGPLKATVIPWDFAFAAAVLACVLSGSFLFKGMLHRHDELLVWGLRVIAYITAAYSTYLLTGLSGMEDASLSSLADGAMVPLALALGTFVVFLSGRRFGTTPTDFLIVLSAVALALFDHRSGLPAGGVLKFVTYLTVMFYGCEVLSGLGAASRLVLGVPVFGALTVVAFRGLLSH